MNDETDTPRTDAAFGDNLVKCYCPRCIIGVHDDIQLAAQYRKHAEWRERAERAEAENVCLQELIQEFYEWSRRDFPTEQEVREIMDRYHNLLNK